jgi:uncharacterized protein (DUF1697 family)
MKYVALLRGINVGGKNLIRMADLRACLETRKFERVSTYIQSGNILFDSDVIDALVLTAAIERALSETFGRDVPVFLRSHAQIKKVVARAPKAWKNATDVRMNVAFLRPPLTAKHALTAIVATEGVDSVHAGDGVVYMSTLLARASQSSLSKVVSKLIYSDITVRNFTTCQKILALMEADCLPRTN